MSDSAPEPQAPPSASTPSYERVRRLAKTLTRACRAGDREAITRIRASLPRLAALDDAGVASNVRLADVQHALAREGKLENWAALKALLQSQEPLIAQVGRFVRAMHEGDGATMLRVLASHPDVARTSLHAACVACDADAVERWLARDQALAVTPFGERGWTPLECVAASPLAVSDEARRTASVAIAGRLLECGADPRSATSPHEGAPALTALFRASARGNAGIVRLLLERGADPNDGESVYHAAEHDHRDVLALLVAHGGEISAAQQPWNNTVLYFLCGLREDAEGRRSRGIAWLLEHGADPNVPSYDHRSTPLHAIAVQGQSAATARMFLDHGADPRRARADGRLPYELAMRAGHRAIAEVLAQAGGAVEALRPVDAVLAACATGDEAGARRAIEASPGLRDTLLQEEPDALVHAAGKGNAPAIRVLVSTLGYDPARESREEGTPLHWAAWHGQVEAVRALLAAGAPIDVRDRTYGSSPIAWASHGSVNCRPADDEYVAIVDLLLAAGAAREPSFNRWNESPENLASEVVADHLRARGFAPEE